MIRHYLGHVADALNHTPVGAIEHCVDILKAAKAEGKLVFTIGNGGSASTASHFVNDLTKVGGIRAFCISDVTPTTLAYGNDDGWDNMFARPVAKLALPGDILFAISCSGQSPNIIKAVEEAINHGMTVIGLTGDNFDCRLSQLALVTIKVLHPDIRVQEDCHLAICHGIVGELMEVK